MTLFGITIPLWLIIAVLAVLVLFRAEIKALLSRLFDRLSGNQNKQVIDEESARRLVLEALKSHGVNIGDVGNLDGQRLIAVLKSFVAFTTALSQMTPNQVDDAVVKLVSYVVAFMEQHPDLADNIAKVLNRIFKS